MLSQNAKQIIATLMVANVELTDQITELQQQLAVTQTELTKLKTPDDAVKPQS